MLVMTTSVAMAQRSNHDRRGHHDGHMAQLMEEFSAQQIAQLETKKLVLALDLSELQQSQMLEVQSQIAEDRKAAHAEMKALKESDQIKKPTTEEKFAKMDQALTKKIEVKQQIKQILNEEQYEKWEQMHHQKRRSNKVRRGKRK